MKRWKRWVLGSGTGWNTCACCVCLERLHSSLAPMLLFPLLHRCSEGLQLLLISLCQLLVASLGGWAMHRQSRWWRREHMLLLHELGPFFLSLSSQNYLFFMMKLPVPLPPTPPWEVSGKGWTISRIPVRSKKAHCLLWDNWEDHVCFSPTLASLFMGLFLPCRGEGDS